jgi:predicted nuclease of predicted toxin-antitoxin system
LRLLVDENISPITAEFLADKGHDVKSVRDSHAGAKDREIANMAREEDRVIITQDTDFGEIYYFSNEEELAVAVVKPVSQKVQSINQILKQKLPALAGEDYGLFVLREDQIREIK